MAAITDFPLTKSEIAPHRQAKQEIQHDSHGRLHHGTGGDDKAEAKVGPAIVQAATLKPLVYQIGWTIAAGQVIVLHPDLARAFISPAFLSDSLYSLSFAKRRAYGVQLPRVGDVWKDTCCRSTQRAILSCPEPAGSDGCALDLREML